MNEWRTDLSNAPQNEPVETKIDDHNGVRNVQTLKRQGRLWFANGMYVYYTPTHWRPITPEQSQ